MVMMDFLDWALFSLDFIIILREIIIKLIFLNGIWELFDLILVGNHTTRVD